MKIYIGIKYSPRDLMRDIVRKETLYVCYIESKPVGANLFNSVELQSFSDAVGWLLWIYVAC